MSKFVKKSGDNGSFFTKGSGEKFSSLLPTYRTLRHRLHEWTDLNPESSTISRVEMPGDVPLKFESVE